MTQFPILMRARVQLQQLTRVWDDLHLRWQQLVVVALLSLLTFVFELFGVSMLFPLVAVIQPQVAGGSEFTPMVNAGLNWVGIQQSDLSLPLIILFVCGLLILRQLTFFAKGMYLTTVSQDLGIGLRRAALGSLVAAPFSYEHAKPHSLFVTNVINEPPRIAEIVNVLGEAISLAIITLGYLALLFYVDVRLALISLLTILLLSLVYRSLHRSALEAGEEYSRAVNATHHGLGEMLFGFREMKIFGGETVFQNKMDEHFVDVRRSMITFTRVQEVLNLTFLPFFLLLSAAFSYVSREVLLVPLEVLLIFAAVCLRMYPILVRVTSLRVRFQNFRPAMDNYLVFMRELSAVVPPGPKNPPALIGKAPVVSLDHVGFAFGANEDDTILKDVSFEAQRGAINLLVGPSGGGKTTVLNLLARLFDVSSGRYDLDDKSAEAWAYAQFREFVSFVPQDAHLFEGTVGENVAFGMPHRPSDEVLIDALRRVGADDFVPPTAEGLQMKIRPRGENLSGGQKQRLAIARAIVRRPKLLLLDEPTSALDPDNEAKIAKLLEALKNDTTLVVVSHSGKLVDRSEVIHRIDGGRVVFSGGRAAYRDWLESYRAPVGAESDFHLASGAE